MRGPARLSREALSPIAARSQTNRVSFSRSIELIVEDSAPFQAQKCGPCRGFALAER